MCGYISGVVLQNVNTGHVVLGRGDTTLTCDGSSDMSDLKSLKCVGLCTSLNNIFQRD